MGVEWQQGRKASSERRGRVGESGVLGGWVSAASTFMVVGRGSKEGRWGKN